MVYGFWHSNPDLKTNDGNLLALRVTSLKTMDCWPIIRGLRWQLGKHRPESKGWVRARSADPIEKPLIQPNYLSEEIDRKVTVAVRSYPGNLCNQTR